MFEVYLYVYIGLFLNVVAIGVYRMFLQMHSEEMIDIW